MHFLKLWTLAPSYSGIPRLWFAIQADIFLTDLTLFEWHQFKVLSSASLNARSHASKCLLIGLPLTLWMDKTLGSAHFGIRSHVPEDPLIPRFSVDQNFELNSFWHEELCSRRSSYRVTPLCLVSWGFGLILVWEAMLLRILLWAYPSLFCWLKLWVCPFWYEELCSWGPLMGLSLNSWSIWTPYLSLFWLVGQVQLSYSPINLSRPAALYYLSHPFISA